MHMHIVTSKSSQAEYDHVCAYVNDITFTNCSESALLLVFAARNQSEAIFPFANVYILYEIFFPGIMPYFALENQVALFVLSQLECEAL